MQNMKNPKSEFLGTSTHAHTQDVCMQATSMRAHTWSIRTHTHLETQTQKKQRTNDQVGILTTYHVYNMKDKQPKLTTKYIKAIKHKEKQPNKQEWKRQS